MQSSSVIYMYLPLVFYIWFLYFHIQCKGKNAERDKHSQLLFKFLVTISGTVHNYIKLLLPHYCTEIIL